MAIENPTFIDDVPFKTPFIDVYSGFSIAIFDYRRVNIPHWTAEGVPPGRQPLQFIAPPKRERERLQEEKAIEAQRKQQEEQRAEEDNMQQELGQHLANRQDGDGKMGKLVATTLVVAILFVWALTNWESLSGGSWNGSENEWEKVGGENGSENEWGNDQRCEMNKYIVQAFSFFEWWTSWGSRWDPVKSSESHIDNTTHWWKSWKYH